VSADAFAAALPRLAKAKGVVVDLRCDPWRIDTRELLGHLIDEPAASPAWSIPVVTRPDRAGMTFERVAADVRPLAPHVAARLAFLTCAGTGGAAESCVRFVADHRLGEIVGSPTAGTSGHVSDFRLPGDYTVTWTGMPAASPDGSPQRGTGVELTVPVARTIAGVAAGRDEALEKAIELLSK
jgi:C-terminal processing protease CtpA/Prc